MNHFQKTHQQLIIEKISEVLYATDETYTDRFTKSLDDANRIFIAGAGRSKLVGSFLAMRLMQSGYDVTVVGEVTTPAIRKGDLMVTISGSGETEQLISFANRAKRLGATLALVTTNSDSRIGRIADQVFQIGVVEMFTGVKGMPMGTLFELSTLCFLEALISHIIWERGIPEREMKNRHANLE